LVLYVKLPVTVVLVRSVGVAWLTLPVIVQELIVPVLVTAPVTAPDSVPALLTVVAVRVVLYVMPLEIVTVPVE
jgi:hypothetical protein